VLKVPKCYTSQTRHRLPKASPPQKVTGSSSEAVNDKKAVNEVLASNPRRKYLGENRALKVPK
jgi:hypothetical protein